MSAPKGFDWYVTAPARKTALEAMTEQQITLAVEGETDWEWVQKLVVPNRVEVTYELGNAGGKDWVLNCVRASKARQRRVIGIIDRDLEGLLGSRTEHLEPGIFDTEVRDVEVLFAACGALYDALVHEVPPKRASVAIRAHAEQIVHEALKSAATVGAFEFASAKRFEGRSGKVVPNQAWNELWQFYGKDPKGNWAFDFKSWLLTLENGHGWSADETKRLGVEAAALMKYAGQEAEVWLQQSGIEVPTEDEINRARHLMLARGHNLIYFVSKAWCVDARGTMPTPNLFPSECSFIAERCRLMFGVGVFRTTELCKKVEDYCRKVFGQSEELFRIA